MGIIDAVPATFELLRTDESERLRFEPLWAGWDGQPVAVAIESLELELVRARDRDTESQAPGPIGNQRTELVSATLAVSLPVLGKLLTSCPLGDEGVREIHLWMGPGGPRLAGRFAVGRQEAAFTVRIGLVKPAAGGRRLRLHLSDVRLFGPLPLPGPLIGVALARAIGVAAERQGIDIRSTGATLTLDPLELALVEGLVKRGWRLPDLAAVDFRDLPIEDVRDPDNERVILRYERRRAPDEWTATNTNGGDSGATLTATRLGFVEGERLPEGCAGAEDLLFAGDLAEADRAYRQLLTDHPNLRFVHARLLALSAAAGDSDVGALADQVVARWPEYLPGLLHAAVAAVAAGQRTRAAGLFDRVATLAEAAGETEDATRARAAAGEASQPPPAAVSTYRSEGPARTVEPDEAPFVDTQPHGVRRVASDQAAAPTMEAPRDSRRNITAQTTAVYAAGTDAEARAETLSGLLQTFEALTPAQRHEALLSFGRVAETSGDLEFAEEAYWRAASAPDLSTHQRAQDLTSHARVLLSRGNDAVAMGRLEEALALAPAHVGALALMAEHAFQQRDWPRARHAYAALDRAPDAGDVISRDVLVFRRAVLARALDDAAEAERCYAELTILNPRNLEARQALAQLALERQDLSGAIRHLKEVLRLVPRDGVTLLTAVRQHLGELHFGLGEWAEAREYLELVVAHDPTRLETLERLTDVYDRLGRPTELIGTLERLARLDAPPRLRATALWRQGEVWRERLGDEDRAFEAYLKASDLDPTHVPTAIQLMRAFWQREQWSDVAAVGDDLLRLGPLSDEVSTLARLRLAAVLAFRGSDPAKTIAVTGLSTTAWEANAADALKAETRIRRTADAPPLPEALVEDVLQAWKDAAPVPTRATAEANDGTDVSA